MHYIPGIAVHVLAIEHRLGGIGEMLAEIFTCRVGGFFPFHCRVCKQSYSFKLPQYLFVTHESKDSCGS